MIKADCLFIKISIK